MDGLQNEQITAFNNEIESIEKMIALLSQQEAAINSSISQNMSSLEQLKNQQVVYVMSKETMSIFKWKERKIIEKEKLPKLNRNIEEHDIKICELKEKLDALKQQRNEAQKKLIQIRQEKDKIQEKVWQEEKEEAEKAEKCKKEETLINSASQGDAKAQYDLSVWYFNEKNFEQYMHWLKQAAEHGHPTAQYQLGVMYLEGKNTIEKDSDKAFCLLEKSANNDNADAQYQLATLYADNIEKKIFWLDKAVKQGQKQAFFDMARLHVDKVIPNADFNVAFKLLSQVVNDSQNPSVPLAMIYLGALYCAGKGTERDPKQGANYIEKGMSLYKGELDPNFSFRLGMLHYDGRVGVGSNAEESIADARVRKEKSKLAINFFKIASVGGIKEAEEYIIKAQNKYKETLEKHIRKENEWINTVKDFRASEYQSISHKQQSMSLFPDNYTRKQEYQRYIDECQKTINTYNGYIMESCKEIEIAEQEIKNIIKEIQKTEDKAYDW